MPNFDEPDLPDPTELEPTSRPRVESIGDPAIIARQFQGSATSGAAAAARRVAESFQLPSSNAIKDVQAAIAKTALSDITWAASSTTQATRLRRY
jgi:hypothetical protein